LACEELRQLFEEKDHAVPLAVETLYDLWESPALEIDPFVQEFEVSVILQALDKFQAWSSDPARDNSPELRANAKAICDNLAAKIIILNNQIRTIVSRTSASQGTRTWETRIRYLVSVPISIH
jgi:hypothetical protein